MEAGLAKRAAPRALGIIGLLALGGCSHLHWPWHHQPPPSPVPVHELDISGSATPPQYWKRNTLVIDLSGVSGAGQVVMKPATGNVWPVRLAFRVTPGSFGVLEVQAAQRAVLPIHPAGGTPVDLELSPSLYRADTPQITASWGPGVSP
jgi:hypothetical protein